MGAFSDRWHVFTTALGTRRSLGLAFALASRLDRRRERSLLVGRCGYR